MTEQEKRMEFSTFVLSLATTAQVHLGAVANPSTGKQEKNLEAAKQMIDMIGMLQDKTKGNLTDMESRLLENVLFDLRVVYVECSKKPPEGGEKKEEGK